MTVIGLVAILPCTVAGELGVTCPLIVVTWGLVELRSEGNMHGSRLNE